jgi:curli biogenesis system outer membrane secretion channel CsgG
MEEGDGEVRVVERERLDEIRGELKFQQGGEVDGATAQKIGKLLGVRYMLTGKMTRFACKKTGASTGWGIGALVGKATKSNLAGAVAGSANTHKVKFTGRLDVRLIDTQSGEVLGTFKDEEETADTSVKIAGGGTDVDYDSELANKVFEPVVERLTPKILKKIASVHEENLAEDAEEDAAEEQEPKRVAQAGGKAGHELRFQRRNSFHLSPAHLPFDATSRSDRHELAHQQLDLETTSRWDSQVRYPMQGRNQTPRARQRIAQLRRPMARALSCAMPVWRELTRAPNRASRRCAQGFARAFASCRLLETR